MPRNMIEANKLLFASLDRFCADRNDPVRNSGSARWIATDVSDRRILKNSVLSDRLSFGPSRSIVRLDHGPECYVCTIGFEHIESRYGLSQVDLSAGILTTVLSELRPPPKASTAQIRDVVEVGDQSLGDAYSGHEANAVASLFSPLSILAARDVSPDDTWRLFFLLCVDECRHGDTWIDDAFAGTLLTLAELELLNVPYRMLCRSVFDSDPGAMFLALYRCLEALYAHTSAQKIIQTLQLKQSWAEVAAALEDQLNWHPREENSLSGLLAKANESDLALIFGALGAQVPQASQSLASCASRRVYQLRNGFVHYRPTAQRLDYSKVDWNRLCQTTATLVWHIYSDIFPA